jgi:flagellar biogenesis protein FliO
VLPKLGLPLDAIYTTGTALAIVVGLFLLCVWALRRGGRKTTAVLPEEAVSVLGRVPLAARQFAQLVHFGNKLVLLSVTPTGTETLTEITDPAEVDRLLGLCMQRKTHSSTSEFEEVFRKLATEPAEGEFVDRGSMRPTARAATDAYAAYRGGADRG